MHSPNGRVIATRNKTAQASLAWLARFSMHITWRRSHRHPNTCTVSRGRSRGSECFSLDFEFRNALPLPPPFLFLSHSLARFNLVPRVTSLARSSRMLRMVQRSACLTATCSTASRAIRSWRHSLEIRRYRGELESGKNGLLPSERYLQIPSFRSFKWAGQNVHSNYSKVRLCIRQLDKNYRNE